MAKFTAHKQELGSGMGKHISIHQSEVGKLILVNARHATQQSAFSVDDFIVRKGEHIIF